MSSTETMQAENERLRLLVEEFRQRELADLRKQLDEARDLITHYRAEAERNANIGRQIHLESQQVILDLRAKLDSTQRLPNARI